MRGEQRPSADAEENAGGLAALAVLALLVGLASGVVSALFLLALKWADRLRDATIAWAHLQGRAGLAALALVCAFAAGAAAWLVRKFSPYAAGSGIPHVEAVLNSELPQAPYRIVPIKFVGGVLAIGAGLALGREGPSVQMSATLGHLVGKVFRRDWTDCRALLAAGAGAGLATAFNAPLAGGIFVLEELVRRFDVRGAITALGASATAISVSRVILGDAAQFHIAALVPTGAAVRPLFFVLGALAGLAAVAYNWTLLRTQSLFESRTRLPVEARAALVGAVVGMLGFFRPDLIGGGDSLTQRALIGADAFAMLPLIFLLRLGLGAISYSAGTPGGLFAPMLVLGAQLGLFFGQACQLALPGVQIQPEGFAIVGMAAFFTGVVRAPLTGIVLVTEMTGDVTMLLPMLGACAMAMLTPTLLRNPPIYDSLRERTIARARARRTP